MEISEHINDLIKKAVKAREEFLNLSQEQVNEITRRMTVSGVTHHARLAKLAVEETQRGVYEDKVTKNLFSTERIYNYMKHMKTVGIISENKFDRTYSVADPIGIIAALTPVTNPTSTTMFKSLIAMKTRNPIIFAFHPSAQYCSVEAAMLMRKAAISAGAPENCISWIEMPSMEATNLLLENPEVALILATGGSSMVKTAYSKGKPALGVGPGNVPCYIEKSANIKRAVHDLVVSKTFDNGMICASEQSLIVDNEIKEDVINELKALNCYFVPDEEINKLEGFVINKDSCSIVPSVVGKSACEIANLSGINVPDKSTILICELDGIGRDFPLSREKLSPILSFYTAYNTEDAINKCKEVLKLDGMGHSAAIHSNNDDVIRNFSIHMPVGRIIVNAPSSFGGIGDIYNSITPSLTLGCGSMGHNSTTDNVNIHNLLNIKKVAMRRNNMQWFKIPEKIYFEPDSIQYLSKLYNKKCFIVTDKTMVKLGLVDKIIHYLDEAGASHYVFDEVESDPSINTVKKGVAIMKNFAPDTIIALGGGSPIDAAKGMWLFYEKDDMHFHELKLKFTDIRKRAVKYPPIGEKAKFVAIPTTSGTGSEVTAFAVITDTETGVKYPLTDYELTPDIAIIDPELTLTMPKSIVADTGIDVLTHAIESYVSTMASDYTEALSLKAAKLVFDNLEASYNDNTNKEAREKMHNASCLAGMAFSNAFLGLNHGMAHILGATFHIPHGRANGILLNSVIKYNSETPTKLTNWPKYEYHNAKHKYADISRYLGLPAYTDDEGLYSLINAIESLMKKVNLPTHINETGLSYEDYEKEIEMMSDVAFLDQTTGTNPRMPLVGEIKELYKQIY